MHRKKLAILLAIILVLGFVVYLILPKNVNSKNLTNYPPKNEKVVAFGDSLTEGVGASAGNDFVSVVEKSTGIKILNYGKSGDTTGQALARINDPLSVDPGVVLILLGGNDVLKRVPKEETFSNLEKIITTFQSKGSVVVLLGVRGGILNDGYEKDYRELSKKYRTAYISNVLKNIITKPEYMSDPIHPNDLGYKIIADRVTSVLNKIIR